MSTTTLYYNMIKPDYSDAADIADINGNMDIIDRELKAVSNKANTNASDISTLDSTVSGLSTSKQNATDNSLETTSKQIPGSINEIYDALCFFRKHASNSTIISLAGTFASIQTWIESNFITNKWVYARVDPTGSSGYFGNSGFCIMANMSSANYGFVMLLSDNMNKSPVVFGQKAGTSWKWQVPTMTVVT